MSKRSRKLTRKLQTRPHILTQVTSQVSSTTEDSSEDISQRLEEAVLLDHFECVMSLFKAYLLSVGVLFLALDLLRRSARNLTTLQDSRLAVQLLGPLCLSIASKYEQRSTFSLVDLIKASPNLLPCRYIPDEYQ